MRENNKSINANYREFVGPADRYDLISAIQFNLLTFLGLRETNTLLDIGCGSLRAGRLLIVYLKPGKYYGVEPEKWLVEEGIKNECGQDLIDIKRPSFLYIDDWLFFQFNVQFDFLLAQSIFSHASMGQIESCLTNVAKCMHEYSILAATFAIGEENYKGSEWVYPEKVTYTPENILNMVANAGLIAERTNWFHPSQAWYLIGRPENKVKLVDLRKRINSIFCISPKISDKFIIKIRKIEKAIRKFALMENH